MQVSLQMYYNILSSNVERFWWVKFCSDSVTAKKERSVARSYVDVRTLTVTQQSVVLFTTMFTLILLRALSKHQVCLIYEVLRYTLQNRDLETLHFCVAGSSITKTDKLNPAQQECLKYSTKYFVLLILQNFQNVGRNQLKKKPIVWKNNRMILF